MSQRIDSKGLRRRSLEMVYGLWQSAAGLQTQEYRQAVIANNLANVDTPGFKPDRVTFQERLSAAVAQPSLKAGHSVLDRLTGGLFEAPVYTDFSNASFEPSQGPLDLAIDGDGFFTLRTREGLRYTRDGRMMMDANGNLVHAATGAAVIDGRGVPIGLDRDSRDPIEINGLGQLRQGENDAGRLAIVDFADRQALQKIGQNLFSADGVPQIEATGSVRQGMIEDSSVEPMTALVEMIEVTRTYEMNARMLSIQDETLGRVVNELGRIG